MILEIVVIFIGIVLSHVLNGSNIFDIGTSIKPDFVILFFSFFSLRRGELSGLWIGFFGGLLSDAALGGEEGIDGKVFYKIGVHALSFSLVAYIVGKFTRAYYNENFVSIMVFAFSITLVTRIVTYFIFGFFFHQNSNFSFLTTAIYNMLIAPLTFFIFSWIYKLEVSEGR